VTVGFLSVDLSGGISAKTSWHHGTALNNDIRSAHPATWFVVLSTRIVQRLRHMKKNSRILRRQGVERELWNECVEELRVMLQDLKRNELAGVRSHAPVDASQR